VRRFIILMLLAGCAEPASSPGDPDLGKGSVPGTTVTDLRPDGEESFANDVNDAGMVVGQSGTLFFTPFRALVWTPTVPRGTTFTWQDIGTFPGDSSAAAHGVNNSGHVVGSSGDKAFLWTSKGGMQELSFQPGVNSGYPRAINNSGHVVGSNVRWTVSVDAGGIVSLLNIEQLGTLPGAISGNAFGLNELGQAVGYANLSYDGPTHAVLWTKETAGWHIEDLGTLPGHQGSIANGINSWGMVVGQSMPAQGCHQAVVWLTQDGRKSGMIQLPTLGGCGAAAGGINDQGRIAGWSQNSRNETVATMWTVTPTGAVTSMQGFGRLNGTYLASATELSATINGITQMAGYSRTPKGKERATLWTVQ
jgi:uncharacterized membrane protein